MLLQSATSRSAAMRAKFVTRVIDTNGAPLLTTLLKITKMYLNDLLKGKPDHYVIFNPPTKEPLRGGAPGIFQRFLSCFRAVQVRPETFRTINNAIVYTNDISSEIPTDSTYNRTELAEFQLPGFIYTSLSPSDNTSLKRLLDQTDKLPNDIINKIFADMINVDYMNDILKESFSLESVATISNSVKPIIKFMKRKYTLAILHVIKQMKATYKIPINPKDIFRLLPQDIDVQTEISMFTEVFATECIKMITYIKTALVNIKRFEIKLVMYGIDMMVGHQPLKFNFKIILRRNMYDYETRLGTISNISFEFNDESKVFSTDVPDELDDSEIVRALYDYKSISYDASDNIIQNEIIMFFNKLKVRLFMMKNTNPTNNLSIFYRNNIIQAFQIKKSKGITADLLVLPYSLGQIRYTTYNNIIFPEDNYAINGGHDDVINHQKYIDEFDKYVSVILDTQEKFNTQVKIMQIVVFNPIMEFTKMRIFMNSSDIDEVRAALFKNGIVGGKVKDLKPLKVKWISTGRKITCKDGKVRVLYANNKNNYLRVCTKVLDKATGLLTRTFIGKRLVPNGTR